MLIDQDTLHTLITPTVPLTDWQQSCAPAQQARLQEALGSKVLRERWKYTRLHSVIAPPPATQAATTPFTLNDPTKCTITPLNGLADNTPAQSYVQQLWSQTQRWQNYPLADLLSLRAAPAWLVDVPADARVTLNLSLQQQDTLLLLRLAPHAHLTLLTESHTELQNNHVLVCADLAQGAQLHSSTLLNTAAAQRTLTFSVDLAADAQWTGAQQILATQGTQRIECYARVREPGAHVALSGASVAIGGAKVDQQIELDHRGERATSEQRFHTATADKSTNTFNGRIHIATGAAQTDAQLSNRNLLLTPDATVNAKPELEIYADDVSCSHGATIGQLDADALYYLRSRGIDPNGARQLLLKAFIAQSLNGPHADAFVAQAMGVFARPGAQDA